jgi:putative pyruvate formate lyase activating enzyme
MTAKRNISKDEFLKELENCSICPRECNANRVNGDFGYCNCGEGMCISSICLHTGEEPVISGSKGICNVFFAHCNIQCVFCQNYQISRNDCNIFKEYLDLDKVVLKIYSILDSGTNLLGFVSPSHCVPQMTAIIKKLHGMGRRPVIVYNTNAYDKVETIRSLENIVDVYLPDFKYSDNDIALELSDAPDYTEIALAAIKEMVRQKGTSLRLGENGQAESGVIVRHLVLPGYVENSYRALKLLYEEISPMLHISLMSQYHPVPSVRKMENICREITTDEYQKVLDALEQYGFHRGWVQDTESNISYLPNFENEHPFEK